MSIKIISSQDFRNIYEKFYTNMCNYLWSYDALKALAFVENDIYTSFIDYNKLKSDLAKLYMYMEEVAKTDEKLQQSYDELNGLIDELSDPEYTVYSTLNQVAEVDPDIDKVLKVEEPEEEEAV